MLCRWGPCIFNLGFQSHQFFIDGRVLHTVLRVWICRIKIGLCCIHYMLKRAIFWEYGIPKQETTLGKDDFQNTHFNFLLDKLLTNHYFTTDVHWVYLFQMDPLVFLRLYWYTGIIVHVAIRHVQVNPAPSNKYSGSVLTFAVTITVCHNFQLLQNLILRVLLLFIFVL